MKSRQSEVNRFVFREAVVAQEYGLTERLSSGERHVLDSIKDSISGAAVLDLGVGGGRTTAAMLELTGDYLGVDFSAAMIAICEERFPSTPFQQCDVRDLMSLSPKEYGFIWFSHNGIDALDDRERQSVLGQIFDRLKPGGWFFFSSHNRCARLERPWHLRHYTYQWDWRPVACLKSMSLLAKGMWNYFRYRGMQTEKERYAIRIDSGHEFRCVHYYIHPVEQARQLAENGFVNVRTMAGNGVSFPPGHDRLKTVAHVLYLAQRPERASVQ